MIAQVMYNNTDTHTFKSSKKTDYYSSVAIHRFMPSSFVDDKLSILMTMQERSHIKLQHQSKT